MSPLTYNRTVLHYTGVMDTENSTVFSKIYRLEGGETAFVFKTGSVHSYDLPQGVVSELFDPNISLGSYYTNEIRGRYDSRRIGRVDEVEFVQCSDHNDSTPTFEQGISYAQMMANAFSATESEAQESDLTVNKEKTFVVSVTLTTTVPANELEDFVRTASQRETFTKIEILS